MRKISKFAVENHKDMKITIDGAGRVGSHLARYLSTERQEIYIIDSDFNSLESLSRDYNLQAVAGPPTSIRTLRQARTPEADLFIAVTPQTTENIVACATAKSMGARLTVARVDRSDYVDRANGEVVRRMGVDKVVFPEYLAAAAIVESLRHPWCRSWHEFDEGGLILFSIQLSSEAPVCGRRLMELADYRGEFHVSAIRRDQENIMPRGDQLLEEGDVLYITTTRACLHTAMKLVGARERKVRHAVIMGGGKIARIVVELGRGEFGFSIIEKNAARAEMLARECSPCPVVLGDGADDQVLADAGILDADAFIALTDSSQSNILACLTAREAGVDLTVAEVELEQYIEKAEAFGIRSVVNMQIIASNTIFQLLIDADSSTTRCLALTDAEVARLEIRQGSALTAGPVSKLHLPREITFAAMVREGKASMVTGQTTFLPGDAVIVFCLEGALHKAEKLFAR